MKKVIIISMCILALAATQISGQKGQAAIEKWGVFNIELKGPAVGNPYIDVILSAVFKNGKEESRNDLQKTWVLGCKESLDVDKVWRYFNWGS